MSTHLALSLTCVERKTRSFPKSCYFPPVNLSTEVAHKLRIYQEHFEKGYIQSTTQFYSVHAPAYLAENGVQNYMKYVSCKFCILQYSRLESP